MFNMLLLRYLDPRSKNNVNANFQAALKSAVLAKAAAVYLIALIMVSLTTSYCKNIFLSLIIY